MSKLANRRTILKMMALLPFAMSLGPAFNYFQKRNLPVTVATPTDSACVKLDADAFSELWASAPFIIEFGQSGQQISGFAIKVDERNVVAYPSRCPKWGCSFNLVSDPKEILADYALQSHKPVVTCRCHRSAFDLATGEILSGPRREPLQSFKVKHCHKKICVIVEDAYA